MIKQVKILKDHANLGAKGAQCGLVRAVEQLAFKINLAGIRGDKAVDALKKRAFARAGRPDEHLEFAPVHRETAIIQNGLAAQHLGNAFDLQYRLLIHAHAYPIPMPSMPIPEE